jgi:hypothetical protein
MNKFSVVANGITLDTYDNIGVSFNYQIEDILNITKRTTNYSKTIRIPGTPDNNKFFKSIFDVNVDTITFNPKTAIPSVVQIGEQVVLTGILQLLNVIVNQEQVDYEIVIFGKLKNIIQEWGDYSLRNIDLSEYNHLRSIENITDSWDYTIQKFGNPITNLGTGEGYVYPYIIQGNHTDIYNRMYATCMFPSVYLKTILDKSFQLAGYTYTSNFFESEYFRRLIIPFVEDKLQMDEEEINTRTTRVGVQNNGYSYTTCPLVNGYTSLSYAPPSSGLRAISPMTYNVSGWYKNYEYNRGYYFPLERETGIIGNIELQDPTNGWSSPVGSCVGGNSFAGFTCQNAGYYDFGYVGDMYMLFAHINGNDIEFKSGDLKYFVRLVVTRTNGTSQIVAATDFPKSFQPSGGEHDSPWLDLDGKQPLDVAVSNIYLGVGDKVQIGFGFEYGNAKWKGSNNDTKIFAQCLIPQSTYGEDRFSHFYVQPSDNTLQGKDDEINMNQILPNIKIKDLFVSLLKMFNLVVFDNPEIQNDLIIEPRDDFYNSKKKIKDWTYILDYNQPIKITPMSELDSRSYTYTYKEDSDFYNKSYLDEIKTIYGTYQIDVNNDFSNQDSKNEVLFAPTPDGSWGIGNRVAPYFCDIEDENLKPKKIKPRILFYTGLKDTSNTITLLDFIGQPTNEGTPITQYPYTGMWDDISNPQNDLGFGLTDKIYYNSSLVPVNTLVEKFHKNSLLDIIDINSRLMEADFHLTPKDIAEFDFRDIILIDNAYWRVYKIKNYNPIGSDKTTSVILYKLNNLNIFNDGFVDITFSNKSCPTDIVQKWSFKGSYYISQSGQIITEDCCNSLGAKWSNGKCFSGLRWENLLLKDDNGKFLKNLVVIGGSNTSPNQTTLTEKQKQDGNTNKSPGVIVRGQNNFVGENVKSSIILGDGSSLLEGSKNQIVIGDGITPTECNSITIGSLIITEDGFRQTIPTIIDGGLDEVMRINKTNLIDIIDGGFESVRELGGDSKSRPIIDGSVGSTDPDPQLLSEDWILQGDSCSPDGYWNDLGIWDDGNIWID